MGTIQVGDIVFVNGFNNERGRWPMGRITKTFPGPDGEIRVVEVKTNHGVYIRPVRKLKKINLAPGENVEIIETK